MAKGWKYRQARCWCGKTAFYNNPNGEQVCVAHLDWPEEKVSAAVDDGDTQEQDGAAVDATIEQTPA